jgi:hypothetical protein
MKAQKIEGAAPEASRTPLDLFKELLVRNRDQARASGRMTMAVNIQRTLDRLARGEVLPGTKFLRDGTPETAEIRALAEAKRLMRRERNRDVQGRA